MSWDEVRAAFREARTPEEKKAAADALSKHISTREQDKHLVTMQGGVNMVKLGDLSRSIDTPGVFERLRKIITGR
jgi:hypothetical protein